MGHAFDEDTALAPLPLPPGSAAPAADLGFTAGISHRWDTVGPPNGGFLLALAVRALAGSVPFPDPVTTNICFGGADMRDAYVTCSTTGKLFKVRWPRPGLKLPFNA